MGNISRSVLPLPTFWKLACPLQTQVLQHFMGAPAKIKAPATTNDIIFIGIDVEWYEMDKDKNNITEIGISVIDAKELPTTATANPWDILAVMKTYHLRIKDKSHMLNTKYAPGRPDKFEFGETRFVTKEEAKDFLVDIFSQSGQGKGFRPVVFMGHAVDNDIAEIKKHFGVDLDALKVITATLDTQVMAQETGIPSKGPTIRLGNLLAFFGLQEDYLHTAGNDVACTMVCAFLTASLPVVLTATGLKATAPARRFTTAEQQHMKTEFQKLKLISSSHQPPTVGVPIFCTRCDSTNHMVTECKAEVHCESCAASSSRKQFSKRHMTKKCFVELSLTPKRPEVVVPCQPCNLNTDPKIWSQAKYHLEKDCPRARS